MTLVNFILINLYNYLYSFNTLLLIYKVHKRNSYFNEILIRVELSLIVTSN